MRRIGRILRRLLRWALLALCLAVGLVAAGRWVVPPMNYTMASEAWRLGGITRDWVPIGAMAPDLARAVVAAEDARFCDHSGFDFAEIRRALRADRPRGASTISQQVAKNVYLWPARSWIRKGLEAGVTVVIELTWPKARILEVYLNVAETGEGMFGMGPAARTDFGVEPAAISRAQAGRLAAILPNPKARDPRSLSDRLAQRARSVAGGAATLAAEGRDRCFVAA